MTVTPPNSSPRAAASALSIAAGEDPRLEPVAGRVGEGDPLLERLVGRDRAHRPEDLLAGDLHVGGDVREHGGLDQPVLLAAGEHGRAARPGLLDPGDDPLLRVGVDHRPDVGLLVRRVADLERLDLGDEARDEVVVGGAADVDPLHGDAALPGEGEGVAGELRRGLLDVGVRLDEDRGRVPELERDLLPGRPLAQAPADVARARERDHPDALVLDQDVADLGGRADEHVQPAGRQARLGLELGEEERRERRLARGLEDDRAAGRERGRDLVRDEVQREVEGADRADDSDRRPDREGELPLARRRGVHRDDVAGERAGLDGRHRVGGDGALGLDPGGLQRLARLGADRLRRRRPRRSARSSRDAVEDLGAPVRGERLGHGALGRVDRARRRAPRRPAATRPTTSPE